MSSINGIRFIIGTACNYNCFYCHHEGCTDDYHDNCDLSEYERKVELLYEFCIKEGIYEIAITGGEPFFYPERLCILLKYFADERLHCVINTNASLVKRHIDFIEGLSCSLEFHVNLSSLSPLIHRRITRSESLFDEMESLELLAATKHVVKLNVICLKSINDDLLVGIHKYAMSKRFVPRYLVLYDKAGANKELVMDVDGICGVFNAVVYQRFGYGIYMAKGDYDIEIVKCLCDDMECETCKRNTFLHLDPDLDIKYCQSLDDVVRVDYDSLESVAGCFNEACLRLSEL